MNDGIREGLRVDALACQWEDGSPCLAGISLALPAASRTALLGANGSGKSSLLLALNGSLRASRGRVRWKGMQLAYDARSLRAWRRRVGLVLSDPDHMLVGGTVEADISFGPLNLGLPKEEVRQRVNRVVNDFGLGPVRHDPISTLSTGTRKRLALAGVLAMDPELLLLDEPANGLDAPGMRAFQQSLDGLAHEGRTLIIATHDTNFAWRWATHWLVLDRGEIAFFGETQSAVSYLATEPEGIFPPDAWPAPEQSQFQAGS
jgi:cobalt/nickel transport system ATP-binding protein